MDGGDKSDGAASKDGDNESDGKDREKSAKEASAQPDGDATSKEATKIASDVSIDPELRELVRRLQAENTNLHRVNTSLHEKNHFLSLKHAELEERINAAETKNEEYKVIIHESSLC